MTIPLVAQQALVGIALRRASRQSSSQEDLKLIDAMTLSRGASAALLLGLAASGVRDRRGLAGWLGWTTLIYAAIPSDWLDGPIARRLGTSELGAVLDIESDSWLTLCTSALAVTMGDLPRFVLLPPAMRYLRLAALRPLVPYHDLVSGDPLWTRHVGMAQMMLFIGALAPFRGPITRVLLGVGTPMVVAAQLGTLATVSWRKLRPARLDR